MDHTKLKISNAFVAFCYPHAYILIVRRRATVIAVLKVDVPALASPPLRTMVRQDDGA